MGALEMASAEEMELVEEFTIAEPGTVSERTLRPQDLVVAFYEKLYSLRAGAAGEVYDEYPKVMVELLDADYFDEPSKEAEEAFPHLLEELFDLLSEHSPPFHYFGSHEGDGSDFGYWFDEDSFREAVADGTVTTIEDLGEYIAVDGGFGSITIYSTDTMKMVVSI